MHWAVSIYNVSTAIDTEGRLKTLPVLTHKHRSATNDQQVDLAVLAVKRRAAQQ